MVLKLGCIENLCSYGCRCTADCIHVLLHNRPYPCVAAQQTVSMAMLHDRLGSACLACTGHVSCCLHAILSESCRCTCTCRISIQCVYSMFSMYLSCARSVDSCNGVTEQQCVAVNGASSYGRGLC